MRIDPVDVIGNTLFSLPWRFILGFLCMIAGLLSRMAFDDRGLEHYHVIDSLMFFPLTFTESALFAGTWALVALPALIASIWMIIVFAYDGRGGAFGLFALYVFSYLIVMFRGETAPMGAIIFGVALVATLIVTRLRQRREEVA